MTHETQAQHQRSDWNGHTGLAVIDAPIVAPVAVSLQDWADEATRKWRQSVEAIIAVGQILIQAKKDKPHGDFAKIFKGHPQAVARPFKITQHTGEALMRIARHPTLSNSTHWVDLPSSWRTLYSLTLLPEAILESFIRQGTISPELTRPQADTLVYACARYQNLTAEAGQAILAYRKKLKQCETDACLCRCSCGHVHPDQRIKRQLAETHEP